MQWLGIPPAGSYRHRHSFLHESDPRSKMLFAAIYLAIVAFSEDLFIMSLLGTIAVFLILGSRLPFIYLWIGLKGVFPFLLVLVIYHLLAGDLGIAVTVLSKIVIYIITALSLSFTTAPSKLADGLAAVLSPLRLVRLPVDNFVFMTSVAFRFFPLLIDAVDAMFKAQKLRNARLKGGCWTQIRSVPDVLFALILVALRRADQMATAMDARCYAAGNRLRYGRLRFGWRDGALAGVTLVLLLVRFRSNIAKW